MRNKRIAILESRLGQQMVDLVAKRGGLPLHAPALAEVADVAPALVEQLVHDLQARPAKLAIFQTGVGSRALFATIDTLGLTQSLLDLLAAMTVAVRGPKPTAALRARNLRADLNHTLIASVGPVASAALRQCAVKVDIEASPPKLGPLVNALDAALSP